MGGDGGSSLGYDGVAKRAGAIRIEFEQLNHGKHAWNDAVKQRQQAEPALRVLLGSGRGCVLHGDEMPPIVIFPLRGRVRLTDGERARMLYPNQLSVSEDRQHLQAVGSSDALWVAFVAPDNVWRQLFDMASEVSIPGPVLLPATHDADRVVRRAVVRLAREARRAAARGSEAIGAALAFSTRLLDLQSELDALVKRCPGRTLAQRRGVFLRLQRVCNYMKSSGELDLGIPGYARVANLSPFYFARTFSAVYGETPHAMLVEHRLKRAFQLVSDTELSITEVARATGFEDRCAFARSFKRRFGATASAVREGQNLPSLSERIGQA